MFAIKCLKFFKKEFLQVKDVIVRNDDDGDGRLNKREFGKMMNKAKK